MAREGGVDWAPRQKPSHQGSVLANEMWLGCDMGKEDPIRVGYTGVEVLEWCD